MCILAGACLSKLTSISTYVQDKGVPPQESWRRQHESYILGDNASPDSGSETTVCRWYPSSSEGSFE